MRRCAVWVCPIVFWWVADSLAAAPLPRQLGRPETVVASSGVFDPFVDETTYEIGSEFRFAPRRVSFLPAFIPDLIPTAGMMVRAPGSLYVYGGFRADVPLDERWTFSPGWAVGLFHRSPDFDLGGPLEFRTSLELAYRLPGGSRLGLCLYHLSNAGVFERNPGSESLVLTYSAGLRRRR
jgi:lipid A 3-O-deacylase